MFNRKILLVLKIIVLIYLLTGVALYLIQDLILFHPQKLSNNHQFRFTQKFKELNIPLEDRNLNIVKFLTDSTSKGIVLYFHGNRKNIERYAKYTNTFTKNGYEVWMMDYPGFGKSTGKRTEQTMYNDAALLYSLVSRETDPMNIIVYGKSMGTGVASKLASVQPCKKLILETPYYSIDALAKHYFPIYPVSPMTKYSFPVFNYLKNIKVPITIFHGTADEVIPYKQARKLKEEKPDVELVTIPDGKHNDLPHNLLFRQTLDSLLKN